jgi:hypothetical protein
MTEIQKTCYAVIDQLSLMYDDKEHLKSEVAKLGYTPSLKRRLLDFLDREIALSEERIKQLQTEEVELDAEENGA